MQSMKSMQNMKICMGNCLSKRIQGDVIEMIQSVYQALILEKKGLLMWLTVLGKHEVKTG